ncbi:MAG: S-methyl-5-thioribose-1-phosphate isomerase [Myxococcales bacterium]|nr:S-methyl-5-thioribose-1-phosphate isomerase [Myxococcales bacterium]MDD9969883.1 S-methyl-5-thioribose-1-phosphate isomerase [Myxococcales bacterium]
MGVALSRDPLSEARFFAVELEPTAGEVVLLDQRRLPSEVIYRRFHSPYEVATAITDMVVRGAPAIGIAAAYGLSLVGRIERGSPDAFRAAFSAAAERMRRARPTAVNLGWAVARMRTAADRAAPMDAEQRVMVLETEAESIHRQDVRACRAMGQLALDYVPDEAVILTHCNAGALATGGYGTALGVVRAAHEAGKRVRVLADETRPYLQGARLTAWELQQDGIGVEVITDSMAAFYFQRGEISFCVVGSDRIAANGDVANKIGTYNVAVLAREHGVPFTVAAPWSTVDLACASGDDIPIEQRSRDEVARVGDTVLVADGIGCRHPAFDVTPARLVHAVFTERGVFHPEQGERPDELS